MTALTHAVPLSRDSEGVWRVGKTRLCLDLIVQKYWQGWTPEQIVDAHSVVGVADVYAILAWYLSNRPEVDRYLEDRRKEADELQAEVERKQGRAPVVERLSRLVTYLPLSR